MAKQPATPPKLPPPSRMQLWAEFLKWALGIPAVVLAAVGVIWLAYWAAGGTGLMPRTEVEVGTILLWLGLIVLMYPVALVFWILDLRDGLRAARDWEAMAPEARAAALTEAEAAAASQPKRRSRKKG